VSEAFATAKAVGFNGFMTGTAIPTCESAIRGAIIYDDCSGIFDTGSRILVCKKVAPLGTFDWVNVNGAC
jgi:hypothetical protein